MSSTVIYVGLPEDSKSSITKPTSSAVLYSVDHLVSTLEVESSACNTSVRVKERGVPNAPKSCIAEIFNADTTDGGSPVKNGSSRPRMPRDTPTRPRDTHSRLFGQTGGNASVAPMITDTIRSNIQFGDSELNGSPAHSPKINGSATSTPSREGNPITGDGYKSLNGQINTVTSINGNSNILHNRVPPGGYSSGLW
ncbi:microtubule-associated protein Jupiter isoform X5 [Danaus plexippus]|uniref:microtubule-associated protein Jupiter isoform X5 n=1 Tax=Danaus plexippus TaxID=13037 RepID=UPI0013C40480|nr:microtubule-associated protein Jupiter isoform X5 [Danaus plexippus]